MTKIKKLMAYADTAVDTVCWCIGSLLGALAALAVLFATFFAALFVVDALIIVLNWIGRIQ